MKTVRNVSLGVVFLTELGVLGAVAYWGYGLLDTGAFAFAVLAPAVLGELWALFGSPKARFTLRGTPRVVFEVLWFGAGVAALYAAGQHAWALALGLVCAVSKTLAAGWTRRRPAPVAD
ncbi:YrdB family protein [Streptomyces sp. NBC_00820]|uniref:YrdB family protein n=1 Tax=Streptomyces sp. NBC_00820 TaxID=2975842 RepID=UPI002ECFC53C|nr:YrdB family protein [Streptomyces sp. NBC_00820]